MMSLTFISLCCPVCNNHFRSQSVAFAPTSTSGGKHTDLREAADAPLLPYMVHACPRCNYSGTERDFGEGVEVSPAVKARTWEELAPGPHRSVSTASERYGAAAKIAEWRGAEAREVADLLLQAAWCCIEERDVEAERYFRRLAAWRFEATLAGSGGVRAEERAVVTYLIGELWRRVGDCAQATAWFDRVEQEVVDATTQRWVVDAARQQRDDPREWFRSPALGLAFGR